MPNVQLLLPEPPHSGLAFDRFQFDKRALRVSVESRLTFQDAVHVVSPATFRWQRWRPEFVSNASQLRKVLAVAVWRSVHGQRAYPEGLESDLSKLNALGEQSIARWSRTLARDHKRRKWHHKSLSEHQRKIIGRHVFTESRSGGKLQFLAAVAHWSWNLGLTSCEVAEQLHSTPWHIRITRYRLCNIARDLGFATFVPHHSCHHARNTVQAA
jgi:hypothetical protein